MDILDDASPLLPLAVTTMDADPDGVSVGGGDWRYRINTEWLMVPADSSQKLDSLIGRQVVSLALETHGQYLDLLLTFDDGRSLTAVSDFPYGEWIFSISPRGVPVFDLAGPLRAACVQAGAEPMELCSDLAGLGLGVAQGQLGVTAAFAAQLAGE